MAQWNVSAMFLAHYNLAFLMLYIHSLSCNVKCLWNYAAIMKIVGFIKYFKLLILFTISIQKRTYIIFQCTNTYILYIIHTLHITI